MSYEVAINKAWDDLLKLAPDKRFTVKFLADEYSVELDKRKVVSFACNIPAKDFYTILIIHYLIQKIKGLPSVTREWLTFRGLSGIEGYYPAFRKQAIEPIIRKYADNPRGISLTLERLSAKINEADAGIILEALESVPVLIKLWPADEEFGPDANMFFDRSIIKIFCIEDIVVLAGIVASQI